jgi:LPS biosynthesis protein
MFQRWNKYIKTLRATIQYKDYYKDYKKEMISLLDYYAQNNQKVAIWGGGLKGTSFLSFMDSKCEKINCVVDMNEKLHGTITSTGHRVVGFQYIIENKIDIVLVMNKVFYVDVYLLLNKNNYIGKIFDVDEIIEQKINFYDIVQDKYKVDYQKKSDNKIFGYTIREVQMAAFDILKEVDRVCKKNNIAYFLEAGSALGAERYKGFIPCDDDIDIGMLRNDYDRFKKIVAHELKEGYIVQSMKPGKDYPYPYIQVAKDNTCFVRLEFKKARMHHGIHIDIAPFDNVPEEKKLREKQIKTIQKYTAIIRKKLLPQPYQSKNPLKCFIVNSPYYILKFVPLRLLIYKQQKEFVRYNNIETKYVGDLCTHYKKDLFFNRKIFLPTQEGRFEDQYFPLPNNLEQYLTIMYDDYKSLSPRENGNIKYRMVDVSLEHNYNF